MPYQIVSYLTEIICNKAGIFSLFSLSLPSQQVRPGGSDMTVTAGTSNHRLVMDRIMATKKTCNNTDVILTGKHRPARDGARLALVFIANTDTYQKYCCQVGEIQ